MALLTLSKKSAAKAALFKDFQSRVLKALRGAGFSPHEMKRLEKIMDESHKRTIIFIQALLTSLKLAGIPPDDLARLKELFSLAYQNICSDLPALSESQSNELIEILTRNRLSVKAAYKLSFSLANGDEDLVVELLENLGKSDLTLTSALSAETRNRLSAIPRKK